MEISEEKMKWLRQINSFDGRGGRFESSYSANLMSGCNGGHSSSLSQSIAVKAAEKKGNINGPDQN